MGDWVGTDEEEENTLICFRISVYTSAYLIQPKQHIPLLEHMQNASILPEVILVGWRQWMFIYRLDWTHWIKKHCQCCTYHTVQMTSLGTPSVLTHPSFLKHVPPLLRWREALESAHFELLAVLFIYFFSFFFLYRTSKRSIHHLSCKCMQQSTMNVSYCLIVCTVQILNPWDSSHREIHGPWVRWVREPVII